MPQLKFRGWTIATDVCSHDRGDAIPDVMETSPSLPPSRRIAKMTVFQLWRIRPGNRAVRHHVMAYQELERRGR